MSSYAALVDLIEDRVSDPNHLLWSVETIYMAARKAVKRLVADTRILWTEEYFDDVAGTALETLPSYFLFLTAATWDYTNLPIIRSVDLIRSEPDWDSKQGDVQAAVFDGDGSQYIRRVYIPSVNAADKFGLEFYRTVASPAAIEDEVGLLDWTLKYVVYYACWLLLNMEGEGQDVVTALHYKKRYEMGVELVKGLVSTCVPYEQVVHGSVAKIAPGFGYRLPPNFGRIERGRR